MKKIARKNQMIITCLAILLAVAGYLNYTQKVKKDAEKEQEEVIDMYVPEIGMDENQNENENKNDNENENENEKADLEQLEPGEAIFTSARTFSANAKLNREQVRAMNKESLLQTLNTEGISEEQKAKITDEMMRISKEAELENEIETLLAAKGYQDAVVSISENQVDVVVNKSEVTDVARAQIEDIVKRKTELSADAITITPIAQQN